MARRCNRRGGKRRESDYYPTPDDVADRVVALCSGHAVSGDVLEPSAGSGAFIRAVRKWMPSARVTAVEPDQNRWPALHAEGDALRLYPFALETLSDSVPDERWDLIIGNPPYSLAEQHVRLCLSLLAPAGRLVFLLRLSFLESTKRAALFREKPLSDVYVFSKRPSFTNDGKTDSAAYAVFVWTDGHRDAPKLHWI